MVLLKTIIINQIKQMLLEQVRNNLTGKPKFRKYYKDHYQGQASVLHTCFRNIYYIQQLKQELLKSNIKLWFKKPCVIAIFVFCHSIINGVVT